MSYWCAGNTETVKRIFYEIRAGVNEGCNIVLIVALHKLHLTGAKYINADTYAQMVDTHKSCI